MVKWINEWTNEWMNGSIDQSVNQSINQSTNQSMILYKNLKVCVDTNIMMLVVMMMMMYDDDCELCKTLWNIIFISSIMFPCCQQKRVFVEPFVNLNDPIEIDLLYHQSVSDVFDQKIPLTKADAVRMNCISVCSRQIGLQSNTSTLIPELQPHGRRRLDL